MYVQVTTNCNLLGSSVPISAGQILQIPGEYYNEQTMTRLGIGLTSGQLAVLIPMSTLCPGWTLPISGQ